MTADAASTPYTSICDEVQGQLMLGEPLSDELEAHRRACPECSDATKASLEARSRFRKGPDWKQGDRVLDQYEVVEKIGQGGQGAVYKARDMDLQGLAVALKVVPEDGYAVEEVLNAIGIKHPNVCAIYNARRSDPFRIIVMEYVGGGTLGQRLAKGPIPEQQAMLIFRGICEGVRAAHGRNVHHLDLKPGNVLLRDGLVPVVCDFGLATLSGSAQKGGTAGYRAPEQGRGERVDQRADVYALGVILSKLVPNPQRPLGAVIERARHPTVDERTATVAELLALLDAATAAPASGENEASAVVPATVPNTAADAAPGKAATMETGSSPANTPRTTSLQRTLPAVVGAVALAVGLGWMYWHRATSESLPPPPVATAPVEQATGAPNAPATEPAAGLGAAEPVASQVMRPSSTPSATTPAPVASSSSSGRSALLSIAAERSGDAEGCLRALEGQPETSDILGRRGRCLMLAGRCSEGRQLVARSVPSSAGTRLAAKAVAQAAGETCPEAQLTDEERVYRAAQRVGAAITAQDPAACDRAGREFWAAYRHARPSPEWDGQTAAGVLQEAALFLGSSGHCDEGRAMWRLRTQAFFGGTPGWTMSNDESDAMFNGASHCATGRTTGR